MNLATPSHRELSTPTTTLRFPSVERQVTESGDSKVVVFEAVVVHPPQRDGWRDINDRIADISKDSRRAAALQRARARLSESLFKEHTLSSLRLSKGMSQSDLAAAIGTSQGRVSRIEAGLDDPLHSTVRKLAAALGVGVEVISNALAATPRSSNG